MSIYTILEAIRDSRFLCVELKLSGSPPAHPPVELPIGYQKPTLQQRYEEIKKAAQRYEIVQFGLTCGREDYTQERYGLSTYNFNLKPVPDRTLHISRLIRIDPGPYNVSSISNSELDKCFENGIPYCSREEEDHSRTIEYGDAQKSEHDSKTLERDSSLPLRDDLLRGLNEFFYVTNTYDGVKRLRARKPGDTRTVYYVPVDDELEKKLVHEIINKEYPELRFIKDASRGPVKAVQIQIRLHWEKQMKNAAFEERLRSQVGFRFVAEALCPKIDRILDARLWSPLGFDLKDCQASLFTPGFLDSLIPPPPPKPPAKEKPDLAPCCVQTKCKEREADLKLQYTMLIDALLQKEIMLVGDNLFVALVYIFKKYFGPLPTSLQQFVPVMKAMFPLIVDLEALPRNRRPAPSEQGAVGKLLTRIGPKIYEEHPVKTPAFDAGCESYLTAVAFLNRASCPDKGHVSIHPVGSPWWKAWGNRIVARGTQEGILDL